ncbi:GyrI-like domain-containing protein [Actinomycetospora cinnamomea]|uniref:Effector-binding domain-containing protein n=1 Tax=Actinomycetospora cinnamomea TaxID=663609 RepID=A0A2U1FJ15_9PSEU|nr:GyrI-like domain-containing protein [Actinomycetospora cinnamomea]PVZ11990.1 effector-binding domain-containing protein [Actinomycetospora cinnamomea]
MTRNDDVTFARETGRRLAAVHYEAQPEDIGPKAGDAFRRVAAHLARVGVPIAGPAVSVFEADEDAFHVTSGFVVDRDVEPGEGVEPFRLPEVEVATTTHIGPYQELDKAYDALGRGAAAAGRRVDDTGPMWEEYWSGPETPPAETRTVVFRPLTPRD